VRKTLADNNLLRIAKDLQKSLIAAAARFVGNHAQELGNLERKAQAAVRTLPTRSSLLLDCRLDASHRQTRAPRPGMSIAKRKPLG
jgi:hypothetical protein